MKIRTAKKQYKRWLKEVDKNVEKMSRKEYERFCETVDGYDGRGKFDLYECNWCSHHLFTTYAEKGVTPFTMGCKECGNGTMYHSRTFDAVPSEEKVLKWIRPTYEQYRKLHPGDREHINMGGLILETKL